MIAGFSNFVINNILLILVGLVVLVVVGYTWIRQPGQRRRLDALMLRIPWLAR